MPIDIAIEPKTSQYMEEEHYVTVMKERLGEALEKAKINLKYHQELMKEYYDKNKKNHGIRVGDKVMLENKACVKGISPKLARPFKGPYIVERTTDTNLVIRLITKGQSEPIWVHANRCKRYEEGELSDKNIVPSNSASKKKIVQKQQTSQASTSHRYPLRSTTLAMAMMCFLAIISCVDAGPAEQEFINRPFWTIEINSIDVIVYLHYQRNYFYYISICNTQKQCTLPAIASREYMLDNLYPNTDYQVKVELWRIENGRTNKTYAETVNIKTKSFPYGVTIVETDEYVTIEKITYTTNRILGKVLISNGGIHEFLLTDKVVYKQKLLRNPCLSYILILTMQLGYTDQNTTWYNYKEHTRSIPKLPHKCINTTTSTSTITTAITTTQTSTTTTSIITTDTTKAAKITKFTTQKPNVTKKINIKTHTQLKSIKYWRKFRKKHKPVMLKERVKTVPKQYILINQKNDTERQSMKKRANDMAAFIASSIIGLCLLILFGITYTYKRFKHKTYTFIHDRANFLRFQITEV